MTDTAIVDAKITPKADEDQMIAEADGRISISFGSASWDRELPNAEALVKSAVNAVLRPDEAVGILLSDNAELQRLNKQFRGFDKPTNVLSFPQDGEDADPSAGGEPDYLGDIAIALETLLREAREEEKSAADHLSHLVIHGCLHLLGEDHETDEEAERMEGQEIEILAKLGIRNPYELSGQYSADGTHARSR